MMLISYGNCFAGSLKKLSPMLLAQVASKYNYGQASFTSEKAVKSFDEIPGPKGRPDVGTLYEYTKGPYEIGDVYEVLLDRYKTYGKIYKETISDITRVHLLDPDYIKQVYSTEGKLPHVPPLLETTKMLRKEKNMSLGLGNTNGELWYRLRSGAQQLMMRPHSASVFLKQANEVCDDFILRWKQLRNNENGEIDNFYNEILRWNLETAGYICFNKRFGGVTGGADCLPQQMINANQAFFYNSHLYLFLEPWNKNEKSEEWKILSKSETFFYKHALSSISEAVAEMKRLQEEKGENIGDKYAFLHFLLNKPELSYKDVEVITLSLFSDGQSTTCPTIIGQIYCLASNPEKQAILQDEVDCVAPIDEPITRDVLANMPYLKACVKEGFRFFPIGVETSRILQKDLVIAGYNIPAGTIVQLNNNILLRLEEYFHKANCYIPERWLRGSDESEGDIHPYLLTPFGHGPRMCAGRRFAEQEMYIILIRLMQNFHITWPHQERMKQEYQVLLRPNVPARFKFTPRTQSTVP